MTLRQRLYLPREHGAWAMLYVSFLLGLRVGGQLNGAVFLVLVAISGLFIARESLLTAWRARRRGRVSKGAELALVVYLGLTLGSGLTLVILDGQHWLLGPGVVVLVLFGLLGHQAMKRQDRTLWSELLAVVGLTFSAPVALAVARGGWTPLAWGVWVATIAYFSSSVFYVKQQVTSVHERNPARRRGWAKASLLYHLGLSGGLALHIFSGNGSAWWAAAYLAVILRALQGVISPPQRLVLKRIGLLELLYALLFLLFASLAFP